MTRLISRYFIENIGTQSKQKPDLKYIKKEIKMNFTNREHNYIESEEERKEGHTDTRRHNFECEDADRSLGCDLGIDVQG